MHSHFRVLVCVAGLFLGGAACADSAEAPPLGRLPRNLVPSHVAVELKIDPAQQRFSGAVRIDVSVAAAAHGFWMHGRGLHIGQARYTPEGRAALDLSVAVADVSGVLRLSAAQDIPAGKGRIDIDYDSPYGELQGAYKVRAGGDDYIVTQMEPIGARNVFPCFDEPGFKQPWDVSLVIPQALQGVANARLIRTEPAAAGWKKLVFATTEALPSYLIALAVGPWDIVAGPVLAANAVRGQPLALRGIAPRGQGARMGYALAHTGEIVAAEEAYFGIPYPFDKLDLLAAPDFWAGAMENAGLIVYRDRLMYADAQSDVRQRQGYWATHAHELAHQWFGDLVTMPWWDDTWLNEAFATWMSAKIVGRLQPDFHADRDLLEGALRAMDQDSLASTRRVHEPIAAFTDIMSAFDGITYQKGAAVLAMFERFLGEERFRDAIRGYLRQHARGNATSADLVGALAAASDTPGAVRQAFQTFIDQPGVPIVRFGVDCSAPAPVLQIDQRRFLPLGSTASGAVDWQIPLCVRWGDAGDAAGSHEQCGLVAGQSATMVLHARSCPAWVMPNADGAGYYRFVLSPAGAAQLDAHFDRLDEREQRAYADSVGAAYSAGVLDNAGFLRAAARLALAPVRQTATAPIARLAWMLRYLAMAPAERQALRDFVARLYGPRLAALGTTPRVGDSDDDRLLRGSLLEAMVDLAQDPVLRAGLAGQGRQVLGLGPAAAAGPAGSAPGDGALHPDAVAADQRGLALRVAMEDGDAAVFDAMVRQAAASQDPVLRGQLLGAAGAARQPALRERARALALDPVRVRRNEIPLVLGRDRGLDPAEDATAAQAARTWLLEHFEALSARLAPAGGRLVLSMADGLCDNRDADDLAAQMSGRIRDLEGGPRAVAQAVEGVRLCAALKARQQASGLALPPPSAAPTKHG